MVSSLVSSLKKSLKLINASKIPEAIDHLKRVAKNYPKETEPINLLAELYLKDLKEINNAQECLEKSLSINPNDANCHFYMGLCHEKNKEIGAAFESYKKAHALEPENGPVLHCIARILHMEKHFAASIHYGQKAAQYLPNEVTLYSDLAFMCHSLGMSREAFTYYKKCLELDPNNRTFWGSLIFISHKISELGLKELQEYAQEFYTRSTKLKDESKQFQHQNRYEQNKKRLKLGFVSADFKTHPAGYSIISVFEKLDRSKFELNLYFNGTTTDFMTDKFKNTADQFMSISDLDEYQIANQINQDQIDILFDLSGFTSGERLKVFTYKPAPVQATYIGYFGTLGMPEIDFIIADDHSITIEDEKFYTEKICRMPECFSHCKLDGVPEANKEAPHTKNGYITFGSFNTFHKISKSVLLSWIDLLKAVPNSKLLFDSKSMLQETDLDFFRSFFTQRGIAAERLILRSNIERADFLQSYNDVDIALDPFPLTGSTSTMEALLMGVPVVTIKGTKWSGKMSSSILNAIEHQELISTSPDEYISKLIELANNKVRIQNYRTTLRNDMHNSGLNIDRYVTAFEQALFNMWQIKCQEKAN